MNRRGIASPVFIVIAIAALFILGGGIYLAVKARLPAGVRACTEEAKQCPDGSYVGRTGPSCEFTQCPNATSSGAAGTLSGKVSIGPICPVERVGVPCPVPPEAYTSREVIVYTSNGTTVVARAHFNSDGTYRFELPAGQYVVAIPQSGIGGSKDLPKTITVSVGKTTTFDFDIDTGIR